MSNHQVAPSLRTLWYECLFYCCCCDEAKFPRVRSGRSHIFTDESVVDRHDIVSRQPKSPENNESLPRIVPKTRRLNSKSSWYDTNTPIPMVEIKDENGKIIKSRLRSGSILSFTAEPNRKNSILSLGIHSTTKIGTNGEVDDRYMNAALEID